MKKIKVFSAVCLMSALVIACGPNDSQNDVDRGDSMTTPIEPMPDTSGNWGPAADTGMIIDTPGRERN